MKKNEKFENKFGSEFNPSFIEKLVMKYEKHRSDVMSEFISKKHNVLLDLACGDGLFIKKNIDKFKSAIGLDIAKHRIVNSKKELQHYKNKVILKVHDLDNGIPLKDSSVDIAVCEASIGCLNDPEFFIKEVNRVLKKNGKFILQIGNYAFITRRITLLLGNLPKISSFKGFGDGGMLHYFTFSSLKDLLEKNGFVIKQKSNSGLFAKFRKFWPELLSSDIIYYATKK